MMRVIFQGLRVVVACGHVGFEKLFALPPGFGVKGLRITSERGREYTAAALGERRVSLGGQQMTNPPGHLWRDKLTALSGPLSLSL